MTKVRLILLCYLTGSSLITLGQRIGYVHMDTNGDINNPGILLNDYDAVIEPFVLENLNAQIFDIQWPDYLTDGQFVIRIVHNAIYLRNGHDNPNLSHIFWISPLNDQQYGQISELLSSESSTLLGLEVTRSGKFKRYIVTQPSLSTDIEFLSTKRDSLLLNDANGVIKLLNSKLEGDLQFKYLSSVDLTPVPIFFDEDELQDASILLDDY